MNTNRIQEFYGLLRDLSIETRILYLYIIVLLRTELAYLIAGTLVGIILYVLVGWLTIRRCTGVQWKR